MEANNMTAICEALENSNGLLEELALMGEWGESAQEQIAENNAAVSMAMEADNTMALREAMALLRQKITDWYMNGWIPYSKYDECEDIVKSALEKPPHNCLSALKA